MFDNHTYNLMAQMAEENQSLMRIKRMYKTDAEGCNDDLAFWRRQEKLKEDTISELSNLIRSHLD